MPRVKAHTPLKSQQSEAAHREGIPAGTGGTALAPGHPARDGPAPPAPHLPPETASTSAPRAPWGAPPVPSPSSSGEAGSGRAAAGGPLPSARAAAPGGSGSRPAAPPLPARCHRRPAGPEPRRFRHRDNHCRGAPGRIRGGARRGEERRGAARRGGRWPGGGLAGRHLGSGPRPAVPVGASPKMAAAPPVPRRGGSQAAGLTQGLLGGGGAPVAESNKMLVGGSVLWNSPSGDNVVCSSRCLYINAYCLHIAAELNC